MLFTGEHWKNGRRTAYPPSEKNWMLALLLRLLLPETDGSTVEHVLFRTVIVKRFSSDHLRVNGIADH